MTDKRGLDMKEMTQEMKEQLSSLVDSESHGEERESLIALLKREPELQKTWARYHLIGEVLRKKVQSVSILDGISLHSKVQAVIGNEPFAVRAGEFNSPVVLNTYHLQDLNNDEMRSAP
jgi:negative regulator of sigma E activity